MNRTTLVRMALGAALTAAMPALGPLAWAQAPYRLEIIPLRHRPADQVLPALQPLLEPGALLSAHGNQLFLRASPANVAELRRVLEAIDQPARRLRILVRFDDAGETRRQAVQARGRIGEQEASVELRARADARRSEERVDQRVMVLEGGRAYIGGGVATRLQDRVTGFDVIPRLSGDQVTLEIAARRDTLRESRQAASVVRGRLGEWLELAGTEETTSRSAAGLAGSAGSTGASSRRVWVKVEEPRP